MLIKLWKILSVKRSSKPGEGPNSCDCYQVSVVLYAVKPCKRRGSLECQKETYIGRKCNAWRHKETLLSTLQVYENPCAFRCGQTPRTVHCVVHRRRGSGLYEEKFAILARAKRALPSRQVSFSLYKTVPGVVGLWCLSSRVAKLSGKIGSQSRFLQCVDPTQETTSGQRANPDGRPKTYAGPVMTTAKVYADVNLKKPKEYWDYENFNIHWR